jgi:hypothetical protein
MVESEEVTHLMGEHRLQIGGDEVVCRREVVVERVDLDIGVEDRAGVGVEGDAGAGDHEAFARIGPGVVAKHHDVRVGGAAASHLGRIELDLVTARSPEGNHADRGPARLRTLRSEPGRKGGTHRLVELVGADVSQRGAEPLHRVRYAGIGPEKRLAPRGASQHWCATVCLDERVTGGRTAIRPRWASGQAHGEEKRRKHSHAA